MGHARKNHDLSDAREDQASDDRPQLLSVVLHLDDLMPDKTGAVVLQADGERLEIRLEDWDEILTRGIAPDDTQSEHFDVSGMDFVTFANGVTLYFPAGDILLTLKPSSAPKRAKPHLSLFQLIDQELKASLRHTSDAARPKETAEPPAAVSPAGRPLQR
jgi:hypothetical protein